MIESENNLCFIQGRRKKKNILRKRLPLSPSPPPLMVNLLCFCFGVLLTLYYDYMCSETDFTQEKAIFIQLLDSPIPPSTAAALRMTICKTKCKTRFHSQGVILNGF